MLEVHQIPAWTDNYIYILRCTETDTLAVLDPTESDSVISYLISKQLSPKYIFNTHHHPDHIGGNLKIKDRYNCKVYCSDIDRSRIPTATHSLKAGDTVTLGNLKFQILFLPGHTLGHIAYHCKEEKSLFLGDVLFNQGCGRLFEGTPKQMYESLHQLKDLPKDTQIYCAHEYTEFNLKFWCELFPDNMELKKELERIQVLRKAERPTVPFHLGPQLNLNPFLTATNLEEFTERREARDRA